VARYTRHRKNSVGDIMRFDEWDIVNKKHNFHSKYCECAYCVGFEQGIERTAKQIFKRMRKIDKKMITDHLVINKEVFNEEEKKWLK